MDFLNKAKSAMGSGGASAGATNAQQPADGQKEDYVDKGMDAVQKKFGFQQSRETNERITDAGRDMYEKQTGKKVSDKISN
eukprot:c8094_g1_i1 orf=74-316(+)